tara:strand:+ start:1996 stop:2964 length:969 start_codon:yes stop_codon:yes gene_type:complete
MMPLNMSRLLKRLQFRTGQSRDVVYFRPPIYGKDSYGNETGEVVVKDINLPEVPAYVRIYQQQDFVLQQGGHNIIGAARVYLPRLDVLKNAPNFDQNNNINFNQVEGWDRIIDNEQTIFTVPVSSTTGWNKAAGVDATFTTDSGTTITSHLGANPVGAFFYSSSANNILASDRYTFQIKTSGSVRLNKFSIWSGPNSNYLVDYKINGTDGMMLPAADWLTIDVPFASGTVAASSSVYISGTRYGVAVTTGSNFNYTSGSKYYRWTISGAASGNKVYLRNARQYKSIEWSVRRIDDYNDEYICLDCVRIAGRTDSLRRAYNDA